jgi:putative endonuclease
VSRRRRRVGEVGERLAVHVLRRHGLDVVARNVHVGRGELDIMAVDGGRKVVVEVRTITGSGEPLAAFGHGKAAQVSRLARKVRAHRVDLMAIRLGPLGADIRWVRGAV